MKEKGNTAMPIFIVVSGPGRFSASRRKRHEEIVQKEKAPKMTVQETEGRRKRTRFLGLETRKHAKKSRLRNALFSRVLRNVATLLRAPSSTPTPKTPETQTMVWVFPPQKLRPRSEFLLSQ